MSILELAGLGMVGISAVLMVAFSLLQRRYPRRFRNISAFTRLRRAAGVAVEDGTRLHFSIGRGNLVSPTSASALAALSGLRQLGEQNAVSDQPPVVTAGDGTLAILAQDTLSAAYDAAGAHDHFDANSARVTGLTPFSYAAGAIPVMRDEQVAANIIVGNFGIEAALITDAAERDNTFTIAGTDNVPAQAVLFATTPEALIGEELYASGAYLQAGPMHAASLAVQDILRWLIVLATLIGVVLKVVGLL